MSEFYRSNVDVVPRPLKMGAKMSFWRKEPPILDTNKTVLKGGMWAHQFDWWSLENFIKVLVGGYGSGKTFIGGKRIISLAIQNAPCPVAIVSPTFPLARETSIVTVIELLQGKQTLYGRDFWWRYNKSTHEFKIRFRGRTGRIIVYSGDDPLSLRGPNLAGAWIDEPFIQVEEVFKQMIARIRHPDAVLRELLLTGTPEQLNWGYDLCMGELNDKHDVGMVNASTRGNLALDEGYVKRLEGAYADKAAEAYIEGKFVSLGTGLVYYAFDHKNNIQDLPIPDDAELGVGMDFNVNPFCFTVFWRAGSHMHYFAEHELPNADTEYACSLIREKYPRVRKIYPDASGNARKTSAPEGRSDFTYIEEAGLTVEANHSNPKQRDRENAVNGKLKPKNGPVTLTVSPKCKKLIKYQSTYCHELKNKQKQMSHLLDAYSYPIAYLYPVDKDHLDIHRLKGV